MPNKPKMKKENQMANETAVVEKKQRKAQGPRTPAPLYAFASLIEGKITIVKSFRDPRKMAEYIGTATVNGEQLLVISPEA